MQNLNLKFKSDLRERCYQFGLQIIYLTDFLPNKKSCWIITDQLIRAATSIGANLIEAKASSSRLEFKKFYEIALKSSLETRYWLRYLKDLKFLSQEKIDLMMNETEEISKMLGAGVIKLKAKL